MSKAITTIEQAISRYFDAVGEGALWPRINDCYEDEAWARRMNAHLSHQKTGE